MANLKFLTTLDRATHRSVCPAMSSSNLFSIGCTRSKPGRYRRALLITPGWASHIVLEVTGVCVEHMHNIFAAGVAPEGTHESKVDFVLSRSVPYSHCCFKKLRNQVNGPESWAATPSVGAAEFERVSQ